MDGWIDDSDSMISEENGQRMKTLVELVSHIMEICSMANEYGLPAIRFMNRSGDMENWTIRWHEYLDGHRYRGLARIGTELKRVLDEFAVGHPNQNKPLLLLIFTDGLV